MLCCVTSLHAQNFNRPVPANVPPYEFVQYDSAYQGSFLVTPFNIGTAATDPIKNLLVLDSDGYVFWYRQVDNRFVLDFKYDEASGVYQYMAFNGPLEAYYTVMDSGFSVLDTFVTVGNVRPDNHDFHITEDNTYLVAGLSDSIMDLSAYLFNFTPGSATTRAIGFAIQEFDEDHNLLFQWKSNDHINPGATFGGYGYNPMGFNYCHGNSIEEDTDGHLLVSFRHLNAVYKIHRQTGEVLWSLGGTASSFTFANDAGFSAQHDARRLPNGNISIFDNANQAAPPQISRAVEYSLDTVNWVATKVWEHKYTPGFFASAMGGHQTTADRRHLVNYGISYRPDPSFVLTDDNGNKISELFFQDSFMSYRAHRADLPLSNVQRPEITCLQSGDTVVLFAPPGFQDYAWSNGESTPGITLTTTGTYQVWVNHGVGMLGSEPFVVEDLSAVCPSSSVSNPGDPDAQTIAAWYDLLGRKIAEPQGPGQGDKIIIVRYKNGKMRLKHF